MRRCLKHPHRSKGAAEAQLRALLKRGGDERDTKELCTYLHGCGFWYALTEDSQRCNDDWNTSYRSCAGACW